ncbi:hypothetical protein D3C81_1954460 [compost metagenome]
MQRQALGGSAGQLPRDRVRRVGADRHWLGQRLQRVVAAILDALGPVHAVKVAAPLVNLMLRRSLLAAVGGAGVGQLAGHHPLDVFVPKVIQEGVDHRLAVGIPLGRAGKAVELGVFRAVDEEAVFGAGGVPWHG